MTERERKLDPEESAYCPPSWRWMRPLTRDDLYTGRVHRVWRPPTDVFEIGGDIVIQVEIAGMRDEDFEISLVDQRLLIAGQRRHLEGRRVYQNMEINYGEFRAEVQLNLPLDEEGISATYENGFLFVRLPRAKEHRVRVQVRTDQSRPGQPEAVEGQP
ncbi:MAG: Hsp20/alpha crystallin family protein [Anaerolineae bacterium]|nr:Hsp20/alpha crystallin family protein [Anaerolineae bacterium]